MSATTFKNGYASLSCSIPIIRPHSWFGDKLGGYGGVASIQAGMTAGVAFDFTWTALKGRI